MKSPTWEEYEDQNTLKTDLWQKLHHGTNLVLNIVAKNRMFDYRGLFISLNTQARWQLFINSVTSYACDAPDVMDDDNYAKVLKRFANTSSLWVAQVNTEKVSVLDHLVLAKKRGISPKKSLNMMHHTTQHGVHTVLHLSLLRQFKTNNHQLWYRRLPHNVYSDALFATTLSRRCNRCA